MCNHKKELALDSKASGGCHLQLLTSLIKQAGFVHIVLCRSLHTTHLLPERLPDNAAHRCVMRYHAVVTQGLGIFRFNSLPYCHCSTSPIWHALLWPNLIEFCAAQTNNDTTWVNTPCVQLQHVGTVDISWPVLHTNLHMLTWTKNLRTTADPLTIVADSCDFFQKTSLGSRNISHSWILKKQTLAIILRVSDIHISVQTEKRITQIV